MSYQNTVIIGYAGQDAVVRETASGKKVANVNIAINEKYGDKEITTWFRVTFWNGLTNAAQHINKGQLVLVEGQVGIETWTDPEGNVKAGLTLTAHNMRFLGSKPE